LHLSVSEIRNAPIGRPNRSTGKPSTPEANTNTGCGVILAVAQDATNALLTAEIPDYGKVK
jgi:hypothetical protein